MSRWRPPPFRKRTTPASNLEKARAAKASTTPNKENDGLNANLASAAALASHASSELASSQSAVIHLEVEVTVLKEQSSNYQRTLYNGNRALK